MVKGGGLSTGVATKVGLTGCKEFGRWIKWERRSRQKRRLPPGKTQEWRSRGSYGESSMALGGLATGSVGGGGLALRLAKPGSVPCQ